MTSRRALRVDQFQEPFQVLPENRIAQRAVTDLCDPARLNPECDAARLVFLSGPPGCGKSHLVDQFRKQFTRLHPAARIGIWSGREFAAEVAAASQERRLPDLQYQQRDLQALILEDAQGLEGRTETQRQFLATLDEVLARPGLCLVTSSRPSGQLRQFDRRLISRFRGGVTATVRMPGLTSREKLLSHFAGLRKLKLTPAQIALLAERLPLSPRELYSALIQMESQQLIHRRGWNEATLAEWINQVHASPQRPIQDVARTVAKEYGLSLSQIRSRDRSQIVAEARQTAMFLTREITGLGLAAVGQYFGDRDHTTVLHACQRCVARTEADLAYRRRLAILREQLGQVEQ